MLKKENIKSFLIMNLGLLLLAIGVHFFQEPHDLAIGGVTGLGMVLNNFIPSISMGTFIFILNIILFIIGFIFIGPEFGAKTIYSSLAYGVIIMVMEKLIPMHGTLTNDVFIEMIIGICISAIGMALVFNQNASTGGTDIIAKILNKYIHADIGKSLLVVDFIVTALAFFAFGTLKGMYSIVGVIMNGFIIDAFIEGLNICKKVEIVTEKGEETIKFIMEDLSRGATVYSAKGAYTNTEKKVITSVLPKKEFIRLKLYLREIDSNAFIITYDVHETLGNGFKDIKAD